MRENEMLAISIIYGRIGETQGGTDGDYAQ
jgi:hypothetical protein